MSVIAVTEAETERAKTEHTQADRAGRPAGNIALVDLLDRLLGVGVVLAGDVVISLAGVDLVQVSLRALVTSVRAQPEGGRS